MHESNPEGSTPDFLVADCAALKKVRTVIVKVAYPDVWFLKRPPKDYHPDPESFRRASIIIKAGFKQGRLKDRYVATIVGQAFAPPPPSLPPPGLHVTPEGTYDAGITIQGIYNVKIPPNEP